MEGNFVLLFMDSWQALKRLENVGSHKVFKTSKLKYPPLTKRHEQEKLLRVESKEIKELLH